MQNIIKESREEIAKYLNKYSAQDVKSIFMLISKMISDNQDFRIVIYSEDSEGLEIIEDESGKKPECSLFDELFDEDIKLLREIMDIELNRKKVTKKHAIEIMSEALANDIVFEGLCTSCFLDEVTLSGIMESVGCANRFALLTEDKVYSKRRDYLQSITEYTLAAVNLYGVIHTGELMVIMEMYEKWPSSGKGYTKKDGTYRSSLFYNPKYYGTYTVNRIIGDGMPFVETTLSGFILNRVFAGSSAVEVEGLVEYKKKKGDSKQLSEDDLQDYFDSAEPLPYRILHDSAIEKDRYIPDKESFLLYADESYIDESEAAGSIAAFLRKNFKEEIQSAATKANGEDEEIIDNIIGILQEVAMDRSEDFNDRSPTDLVKVAFQVLEEDYDIIMNGIDQANEFLGYLMDMANNSRLWINNGHTPNELRDLSKPYNGQTTIVPASSEAAKLLSEAAPQMIDMGFNVDLDSAATEIPTFTYNHGVNGTVTKSAKKIYPNDPCPCGSGKKYKKCCGRN